MRTTKPIAEISRDETAREGAAEIFDMDDHPKAKRCYAWAYDDKDAWHTTAVLELPPVDSLEMAVKAAIAAKARKKQER